MNVFIKNLIFLVVAGGLRSRMESTSAIAATIKTSGQMVFEGDPKSASFSAKMDKGPLYVYGVYVDGGLAKVAKFNFGNPSSSTKSQSSEGTKAQKFVVEAKDSVPLLPEVAAPALTNPKLNLSISDTLIYTISAPSSRMECITPGAVEMQSAVVDEQRSSCEFKKKITGSPLVGIAKVVQGSLDDVLVFVFDPSYDQRLLCAGEGCGSGIYGLRAVSVPAKRIEETLGHLIKRGLITATPRNPTGFSFHYNAHLQEWFIFYLANHSVNDEFLVALKPTEKKGVFVKQPSRFELGEMPLRFGTQFYAPDSHGLLIELEDNAACSFFRDRTKSQEDSCNISKAKPQPEFALKSTFSDKGGLFKTTTDAFYKKRKSEKLLYFNTKSSPELMVVAREDISNKENGVAALKADPLYPMTVAQLQHTPQVLPVHPTRAEKTFGGLLDALDLQLRDFKGRDLIVGTTDQQSKAVSDYYNIRTSGFFGVKVKLASKKSSGEMLSIVPPKFIAKKDANLGEIPVISKAQLTVDIMNMHITVSAEANQDSSWSFDTNDLSCDSKCASTSVDFSKLNAPAGKGELDRWQMAINGADTSGLGIKRKRDIFFEYRSRHPEFRRWFKFVFGDKRNSKEIGLVLKLEEETKYDNWVEVLDYLEAAVGLMDIIVESAKKPQVTDISQTVQANEIAPVIPASQEVTPSSTGSDNPAVPKHEKDLFLWLSVVTDTYITEEMWTKRA